MLTEKIYKVIELNFNNLLIKNINIMLLLVMKFGQKFLIEKRNVKQSFFLFKLTSTIKVLLLEYDLKIFFNFLKKVKLVLLIVK